jgi:transcriptional regulator with XRE-family HTH domain
MTQKELAGRVGMSEAVLSHFLRGRRKALRENERRRIASALGLPLEALSPARPVEEVFAPDAGAARVYARGIRLVPVYPIGAGYEIVFGDGDSPVGESLEDPIHADVPDPNAFAGKVVGSSMDPGAAAQQRGGVGFCEGDVVVFDTKAEVRSGCFCLVRFEDAGGHPGTTFKQIFFEGEGVRLHPLNPEFPDEVRSRSQIRAIYRAVRHIRRI